MLFAEIGAACITAGTGRPPATTVCLTDMGFGAMAAMNAAIFNSHGRNRIVCDGISLDFAGYSGQRAPKLL